MSCSFWYEATAAWFQYPCTLVLPEAVPDLRLFLDCVLELLNCLIATLHRFFVLFESWFGIEIVDHRILKPEILVWLHYHCQRAPDYGRKTSNKTDDSIERSNRPFSCILKPRSHYVSLIEHIIIIVVQRFVILFPTSDILDFKDVDFLSKRNRWDLREIKKSEIKKRDICIYDYIRNILVIKLTELSLW